MIAYIFISVGVRSSDAYRVMSKTITCVLQHTHFDDVTNKGVIDPVYGTLDNLTDAANIAGMAGKSVTTPAQGAPQPVQIGPVQTASCN